MGELSKDDLKNKALWNNRINQILREGNVYSIHARVPMFDQKWTIDQMILICLVRIHSIEEGVHYTLSFGEHGKTSLQMISYNPVKQTKPIDFLLEKVKTILENKKL